MKAFSPPSIINAENYRRPYLNLRDKLSQIWFSYGIIFIIVLIIQLILFYKQMKTSINEIQDEMYVVCQASEAYSSQVISFPHYMAKVSNYLIAEGVQISNEALIKTLDLMITASEELLLFIIDITVGTYTCVLVAAVDAAADTALNATESVIEVANKTIIAFADDLEDGLQDLSKIINTVVDTADDTVDALKNMFGDSSSSDSSEYDDKMSSVNLTINNMKDWQIPGSINTKIENLRNNVPDFAEVQNYTKTIISKPFNELQLLVNTKLNNTFDASNMYVPGINNITYCDDLTEIAEFTEKTIQVLYKTLMVIVGMLILSMLLFMFYQSYCAIKEWMRIQEASKDLQFANESFADLKYKRQYNIEVINSLQNRPSDLIGKFISTNVMNLKDPVKINNTRWLISYILSSNSIYLLFPALWGIGSFILQIIFISLVSHVHEPEALVIVSEKIESKISSAFNESVISWTNETNSYLQNYQDDVNDNLFHYVNITTTAINSTVEDFMDEMNNALYDIFGDTPLYSPIENIVGCVLTSKLKKVEKAMTWINEKSHLTIPDLEPKQIMDKMISIKDENENTSSELGELKDKAKLLMNKVIETYKKQTFMILYISLGFLAAWIFISLIGVIILIIREHQTLRRAKLDEKVSEREPSSLSSFSYGVPSFTSSWDKKPPTNSFKGPLSNFLRQVKDRCLKSQNYVKTPTEPTNSDDQGHYNENLWQHDNQQFYEKYEMNSDRQFNTESDADGTWSDLGENPNAIAVAKQWSP